MEKNKKIFTVIKSLPKGKAMVALVIVLCLLIGCIAVKHLSGASEETVYRETQVKHGTLSIGVTESGSVDIGTSEQVFELDMNALQRVDADSLGGTSQSGGGAMPGMGGGGGMSNTFNGFNQIFDMSGSSMFQSGGDSSSLEIAGVAVSVGQQISVGDVLYELEEESVNQLKEELESNVSVAKADLEAVYADQKLSKQTAQYTYDSSRAYGEYAAVEYNTAIADYDQAIQEKEEALQEAKDTLADLQSRLESAQTNYEGALHIYNHYAWSRDNTSKTDSTYLYVTYFNDAREAWSTVENLSAKVEQLEEQITQAEKNIETAQSALNKAKRNKEQGVLSAQQTQDLRLLAYNTAQETLDIALAYLEDEATAQEEVYATAQEKWEEYRSHIDGNRILSRYSGVVTSIGLTEGDALHTGDVLVTVYNSEDVTVTVSVDESDMTDIAVGSKANVNLIAYPDETYEAFVTEVSDASTDSGGNVYYEVTATLQGDLSGLFQGMTGDITFVSQEQKNVLYVQRRAVITEGGKSYVKVKNEDGKVEKRQVTTGFTDGVNVEIIEGLTEGETVLIESKVKAQ